MSSKNERIPPVWVVVGTEGDPTAPIMSEDFASYVAREYDRRYPSFAPHRVVKLAEVVPAQPLTDMQIGKIYLDADEVENSYAACERLVRAAIAEFCRVNGIALEGGEA